MSRRIQPLSIALFGADFVLVPLALRMASILRSTLPVGFTGAISEFATRVPWPLYFLAPVVWGISLASAGAYDPQLSLRWFNEALRVLWGSAIASMVTAGGLYLSYRELPRLQFVYFFVLATLAMLAYRAGLRLYYRTVGRTRPGGRNRILILGAGELGERVAKVLLDHSRWGYHPVGFLDDDAEKLGREVLGLQVLGSIGNLRAVIDRQRIHELWIALPANALDRLSEVVSLVETVPIRIKVVPDYFSFALIRAQSEVLGGLPVIGLRDPLIGGLPRIVKRGFDLLLSILSMLVVFPLMGVIALLIRLDSNGPVLFLQERVGENGRLFQMWKFRTMVADAAGSRQNGIEVNEKGEFLHKVPDDPRVTRIGRFLRRYSLDELPQLYNVIKGEMSLVGPRPEQPWLVDRYDAWQRKRFAVPQGITGWWQINGRSDKPMHLHTEDDLYYIYNHSLWLDVLILLRTPVAVLRGEGAF